MSETHDTVVTHSLPERAVFQRGEEFWCAVRDQVSFTRTPGIRNPTEMDEINERFGVTPEMRDLLVDYVQKNTQYPLPWGEQHEADEGGVDDQREQPAQEEMSEEEHQERVAIGMTIVRVSSYVSAKLGIPLTVMMPPAGDAPGLIAWHCPHHEDEVLVSFCWSEAEGMAAKVSEDLPDDLGYMLTGFFVRNSVYVEPNDDEEDE